MLRVHVRLALCAGLLAGAATTAPAQASAPPPTVRWRLSPGLGGNPLLFTEYAHVLGTLGLAYGALPLEGRAEVLAMPGRSAPGGPTTASGSLLLRLPALGAAARPLTPYLIGGVGTAIGSVGHPVRANGGGGIRTAWGSRAVFGEVRAQRHLGVFVSFGVQR